MVETNDYERVKQTDAEIEQMQLCSTTQIETKKGGFFVVVKFFFSSAQQYWKSSCCVGLTRAAHVNFFFLFLFYFFRINGRLLSSPVRYWLLDAIAHFWHFYTCAVKCHLRSDSLNYCFLMLSSTPHDLVKFLLYTALKRTIHYDLWLDVNHVSPSYKPSPVVAHAGWTYQFRSRMRVRPSFSWISCGFMAINQNIIIKQKS